MTTRTLVFHDGALGDFITTLPAIACWRRLHPHADMILLGRRTFGELASAAGYVDTVWDLDRAMFASLFAARCSSDLQQQLQTIGAALIFAADTSPVLEHLRAAGVTEIRQQAPFPKKPQPIVDYHLALFPECDLSTHQRAPRLDVSHLPRPKNIKISNRTIAIHPGSGSPAKNWSLDRYQSVAEGLAQAGYTTTWLAGPAEMDWIFPAEATVWRDPSLLALARFLSECRLYIGNDSGVTHLAAAVGCPVVALFGPSDATTWQPRGTRVKTVIAPDKDLNSLGVKAVRAVCDKMLRI